MAQEKTKNRKIKAKKYNRSVQISGGSSFLVTLPKEWVEYHSIKRKSMLHVYTQTDGSILIKTPDDSIKPPIENELFIKPEYSPKMIYQFLMSAYKTGYNSIKIISDAPIPSKIVDSVIKFKNSVEGFLLESVNEKKILLKNRLTSSELRYQNLINRQSEITQSLMKDVIKIFQKNLTELNEFHIRETEINSGMLLIERRLNCFTDEKEFGNTFNPKLLIPYFLFAQFLKRISIKIIDISDIAENLVKKKMAKQTFTNLTKILEELKEYLNKAVNLYFKLEQSSAFEIIEWADIFKKKILTQYENITLFPERSIDLREIQIKLLGITQIIMEMGKVGMDTLCILGD